MASLDLAASEVNQDPNRFALDVLANGPVQWSETHRAWLFLSHEAVSSGFRDTRLSADRIEPFERVVLQVATLVAKRLQAQRLEVVRDVLRRGDLAGTRSLPTIARIIRQPIGMLAQAIAFDPFHALRRAIRHRQRRPQIRQRIRSPLRKTKPRKQCTGQ